MNNQTIQNYLDSRFRRHLDAKIDQGGDQAKALLNLESAMVLSKIEPEADRSKRIKLAYGHALEARNGLMIGGLSQSKAEDAVGRVLLKTLGYGDYVEVASRMREDAAAPPLDVWAKHCQEQVRAHIREVWGNPDLRDPEYPEDFLAEPVAKAFLTSSPTEKKLQRGIPKSGRGSALTGFQPVAELKGSCC